MESRESKIGKRLMKNKIQRQARYIKGYRGFMGLSQKAFAELVGLTEAQLYHYEKGYAKTPVPEDVYKKIRTAFFYWKTKEATMLEQEIHTIKNILK